MIELKQLVKHYENICILNKANFNFPEKGLICLLGPSGCGKSTLLNILAGLDCNYQGDITVCGKSITQMSEQDLCSYRRDCIGFIFQNYCLLPGYSVMENLLLPCQLHNINSSIQVDKAEKLLANLDLENKASEKIENLSGGQKQRVAIARALIKNPKIILADEPTGSLDRKNSTTVMQILKNIAKDRLVIVVTHDQKICEYADEVISIKNQKIVSNQERKTRISKNIKYDTLAPANPSAFKCCIKNMKIKFQSYLAVALFIAFGVFAFLISISSRNTMKLSIFNFKEKNNAFYNGYIAYSNNLEKIHHQLMEDKRVEDVYYQYLLKGIHLQLNNQTVEISEKNWQPKATQKLSYGTMPQIGKKEIALSPSLAKKFANQINTLIGKKLLFSYQNRDYLLTISGIFNGEYDDFFLSSDLEKKLYVNMKSEMPLSISFDAIEFCNIVPLNQMLLEQGVDCTTAAEEVSTLQHTFQNIQKVFAVISSIVLGICIIISTILLSKLQNSRFKELGLLSTLGFGRSSICKIIIYENILLSCMSVGFNILFMIVCILICKMMNIRFFISCIQMTISILGTGILLIIISFLTSHKLLHTPPSVALRL